jgi:hypothetical protein
VSELSLSPIVRNVKCQKGRNLDWTLGPVSGAPSHNCVPCGGALCQANDKLNERGPMQILNPCPPAAVSAGSAKTNFKI